VFDDLQSSLERLSEPDWRKLVRALEFLIIFPDVPEGRLWSLEPSALPEKVSARTATAISLRVRKKERHVTYKKYLSDYEGNDPTILRFCATEAMDWSNIGRNWSPDLDLVQKAYSVRIVPGRFFRLVAARHVPRPTAMPIRMARKIVEHPRNFPTVLVAVAEARCRQAVARKIVPVGKVAGQDGWFS
jgi:hypothetical protein